ncbi:hypothetical protein [Xanthomonas sacchari]|uniref:hypothetical protein n=1 Tax=Xanthomonas sacchari TaxID=56458 RepID=UPI00224DBF81|nr:hypothetical protein [Xanthomonas sacchari]UYK74055.1 hypothetical protein NG828_06995 [Xanthomonas sacchari]
MLLDAKPAESGAGVCACGNHDGAGGPGGVQAAAPGAGPDPDPATGVGVAVTVPPPLPGFDPDPGFTAEHAATTTQTNAANPIARFIALPLVPWKSCKRRHPSRHAGQAAPRRRAGAASNIVVNVMQM